MKKLFTVLLVLVLSVVSFGMENNQASAAASTSSTVTLTTGQTSASTSRVTANNIGHRSVVNTGSQKVTYRIFKNGVAVTGYITVYPGARSATNFSTTAGAGYSLRVYCGSSSGTGCNANAVITNYGV